VHANRLGPIVLVLAGATGCKQQVPTQAELPAPMVTVANPVEAEVIRYEFATGRAEPQAKVDVRAQVSGPIAKIDFVPGSEVKAGDELILIDPQPFKVSLVRADAEVLAAKAHFQFASAEEARAKQGLRTLVVTQEEYDKSVGAKAEAEAAIQVSTAKRDLAKLDLGYTKIVAPFAGVIGDKLVDVGNYIVGGTPNSTLLATIVSVDPIDVAFDVDENTIQRLEQAVRDGKIKLSKEGAIPVEAGLAVHGDAYPLAGQINFLNNTVDPRTGTLRVKATFPNPKPPVGPRVMTPGNYVRVRVPIGAPSRAMLVPEVAIQSDLGNAYLVGVGADNKVVRLDAVLGSRQRELRVIESVRSEADPAPRALRADERIIVGGLQRVRPGITVDPKTKK
jgi:membrane fusion protein, multidrug efflux system